MLCLNQDKRGSGLDCKMTTALKTKKFVDPFITANGGKRAHVDLKALKTLWFNTGTLCNLACVNCYIKSTPTNDSLVYLTHDEVVSYLDEIAREKYPTTKIGITGGEPFMNPDIIPIMEECLRRGFQLLVLSNAMRPMMKCEQELLRLKDAYGEQLSMRISVDHFKSNLHEQERGKRSWEPMIKGLKWLSDNGFNIDIAGRRLWNEGKDAAEEDRVLRLGFADLFKDMDMDINIDVNDEKQLTLFPEMDENTAIPEITEECWNILGVNPNDMMCASSRMVVKHKGEEKASVMACTLLAYDPQFNKGSSLKEAASTVQLNHRHCAKFCVLGGGSCNA